ncbi:MAG: YoaK family protein [Deltaproteobacteria bacterium]|nr:YoaK family protein [Deltaproteobacteria bacterium]
MSPASSQALLAATLAMIAGCVDAYGFIALQTYVSFMSGNTTQAGTGLGQLSWALALPALTAIGAFFAGVVGGTLLMHTPALAARRLRFLLAALILLVIVVAAQLDVRAAFASIAALAFGMGVMNTCLSQVGSEAVSLTFVTGTLNRAGTHAALALLGAPLPDAQSPSDSHARRALLLLGVWGSFLGGAILSGATTPHYGALVLAAPIVVLLGLALRR